jgi:hypothetical protein
MRLARQVMLATMAIAVTAVTVPAAFAQSEPLAHSVDPQVQVRTEPGSALCAAVTPTPPPITPEVFTTGGGCRTHWNFVEPVITAHVFGIESTDSTCNIEFDMRVDSQGEGYASHLEFTQGPTGTCTRRACHQTEAGTPPPTGQSEGRPWSFFMREEAIDDIQMVLFFCIEPRGNPNGALTHCLVTLPLTEPAKHHYHVVGVDTPCAGTAGFRGELTGTLEIEEPPFPPPGEGGSYQEIEIGHL